MFILATVATKVAYHLDFNQSTHQRVDARASYITDTTGGCLADLYSIIVFPKLSWWYFCEVETVAVERSGERTYSRWLETSFMHGGSVSWPQASVPSCAVGGSLPFSHHPKWMGDSKFNEWSSVYNFRIHCLMFCLCWCKCIVLILKARPIRRWLYGPISTLQCLAPPFLKTDHAFGTASQKHPQSGTVRFLAMFQTPFVKGLTCTILE